MSGGLDGHVGNSQEACRGKQMHVVMFYQLASAIYFEFGQ